MKLQQSAKDFTNTKTKRSGEKMYFFPEKLVSRLDGIFDHPVTLVEAPSGFGKTSAVREYLKSNLPEGAREKWYTCLGEPPSTAWDGICRLFGDIGGDLSWQLSKLFPLTKESLPEFAALMHECRDDSERDNSERDNSERCDVETFLVIDNYQLFENDISHDIINAFSVHDAEKLHIIIITQPLSTHNENVHNANIHKLKTEDFLFDRESTARFCRLARAKLSDEEIEKVQTFSEGWVAAIRLQVENYSKTGSLSSAGSMDELIETAIWNRISVEEREFLMASSLLDGFTEKQAAIMGNWTTLSKSAAHLLKNNFFIPYVTDKAVYSMHSLLRNYLLGRFNNQPTDFVETMNHRAGSACMAVSDYLQAARFYMKVKCFDDILSMPFKPRHLNELETKDSVDFFERFVEECPEGTLRKYPLTVLAFTYQFMMGGKRELFSRMIRLLNDICSQGKQEHALWPADQVKTSRVKGEIALLMSFTAFNDIAKMSAYHKEAIAHLSIGDELASTVVLGTTPWTFGITSVLCLFWREAGRLDGALSLMDECLPIYSNITNGHGTGADSVFRAEACLMRGDDAEAEVMCYKAIYQADEKYQMSIRLCAELILARIAILRGDMSSYGAIRAGIAKNAEKSKQRAISRMGELCLALLDMTLGNTNDLPEWLRGPDTIRRLFYAQGHSYVFKLYSMMLLLENRHAELYGLTDPLLNMARGLNYLLPQVYQHIYLAAAKKKDGALTEASEHLCAALEIALPDRIYLPFAEFGVALLPLLETAAKSFDAEKITALQTMCRRQAAGVASIVHHNAERKSPLTAGEKRIALLAKERLSAREIASRLFISEATVNSTLKSIFSKLEIHSKRDLEGKDF